MKDLEESIRFYRWFEFHVKRRSEEVWKGKTLNIVKMADRTGGIVELIQGDWRPHIAITVDSRGAENDIWGEWVQKVGDPVAFKNSGGRNILYICDPSGNWVEVVNEHR